MTVQKIFSWSEKMKWAIKKFEMAEKKPAVLALTAAVPVKKPAVLVKKLFWSGKNEMHYQKMKWLPQKEK